MSACRMMHQGFEVSRTWKPTAIRSSSWPTRKTAFRWSCGCRGKSEGLADIGTRDCRSELRRFARRSSVRRAWKCFFRSSRSTQSISLGETLAALGMKDAFTPAADFSGITDEPLVISAVVHQALGRSGRSRAPRRPPPRGRSPSPPPRCRAHREKDLSRRSPVRVRHSQATDRRSAVPRPRANAREIDCGRPITRAVCEARGGSWL